MSTQFTTYTKQGILNHYFKASQWSNAGRTSVTVALHSASPGAAGSFANELNLPRQTVTWGSVTDNALANTNTLTFPTNGSGEGGTVVTHVSVQGNDGQMLAYGEAAPNLTVTEGTDIEIAASGLAIGVDTNSLNVPVNANYAFTDARVDEFLTFVFALGTPPASPSALYYCYVDAFDKDGSGSSWAGMGAETIAFDNVEAGSGDAQLVKNSAELAFVTTSAQALGMWVVKDQAYNPIALKELSGAAVADGATVTMAQGDLQVSVD